jgi:hypothetical protein
MYDTSLERDGRGIKIENRVYGRLIDRQTAQIAASRIIHETLNLVGTK